MIHLTKITHIMPEHLLDRDEITTPRLVTGRERFTNPAEYLSLTSGR